eukprot:m.165955 g.165955  ORF g.165955 m.165955 type:complete len:227 (+) comp38904_c0_seq3:182-862(+)
MALEERKRHFELTKFIFEAVRMLKLSSVCAATATTLYHRFFNVQRLQDYDAHLVATSCLYLASKIAESPRKVRDIVNVSHRCLHGDDPLLDVGERYWKLRDSLVTCEFVVLRALRFQVEVDCPHQYLLHYLKLASDWLSPQVWESHPLPLLCWTLLNDSCHTLLCLHFTGEEVAVGVLYMALRCCCIEIPGQTGRKNWWKVVCRSCDLEKVEQIGCELMEFYESSN